MHNHPNTPATILYVESNDASRTALAQLLRDQRFRVLEAGTGQEALRLAEERPDLILLDVHPPDADSFDLCGLFKKMPATASAPVLLFSGVHIKSEDRVRGLEGGADGYLTKPIDSAEILAQIKALLRGRRAEDALARLAAIVESSEDAVVSMSLDGTITSWNTEAERLYGYTAPEALGQPISFLAPPDRPDEIPRILDRLRRGERVEPFETVRIRKDGSRVDVSMSVSPIRDAEGRVVGAANIARDISRQKRAEEALARDALLLANVRDSIVVTDLDEVVTYWNKGAVRLYGWTAEEMVGRRYADRFPEHESRVRADESDWSGEYEEYRKDGSRVWIDVRVGRITDAAGRPTGFLELAHDVSDRRRAEKERDAVLSRLQMQIERMPLAYITLDADLRISDWNPAAERIFGYRKEEVLGREPSDLIGPPDVLAGGGEESLRRLRAGDMSGPAFYANLTKDGRSIICQWLNTPLLDANGRFTGLLCMALDVTDWKQAESELRESERRLAEAQRIAHVGYWENDLVADRITFSDEAYRILGLDPHRRPLTLADIQNLIHPEDRSIQAEATARVLRGEGRYDVEYRVIRPDGEVRHLHSMGELARDELGRPHKAAGAMLDVTDRKRSEGKLRLFRTLIDKTTDGIEVIDPETGRFLDVNEQVCAAHGYTREEYLRLSVSDLDALVGSRPWGELIADRRLVGGQTFESQHRRKDGSTFSVEVSITFIRLEREYVVAVVRDITERRRLENQLRQAQKMEAVGQLAGGVAHDFNNLLQVITGYGELLLETLRPDDPSRELVSEMTRAGERAAGLTRQLLAFSRQSVVAPRVLVLNSVVVDVEKMLRRVIGEDIDLRTALHPDLGRVKADPGQMEQVILNLVVNARDAMPQGGKLTIETRDTELSEEYTRLHAGVRPGRYILLAVSDTGHGMTPEVRARIFEPFFTTKKKGKGTGLGLATVFGIVQQAGGHVAVYSEPGAGTTFKVYLPRVEESVSSAKSRSGVRVVAKGTETVLVVEDEDAVRALSRIVLQGAGYRVLEASDGGQALAVAARHEGPIHLLLSDVVMPVVGGRELAERLVALHPEMKVLFQSGYTDDAVVRHGILQEKVHFLQKPYLPAALAWKVREVLDGPG